MTWRIPFLADPDDTAFGGMRTRHDGSHVTDAAYLGRTEDFNEHLEAVEKTIESYLREEEGVGLSTSRRTNGTPRR